MTEDSDRLADPGCRWCNWSPIFDWSPMPGMCMSCYEEEKAEKSCCNTPLDEHKRCSECGENC